jgi:hypothetical protein
MTHESSMEEKFTALVAGNGAGWLKLDVNQYQYLPADYPTRIGDGDDMSVVHFHDVTFTVCGSCVTWSLAFTSCNHCAPYYESPL